jgi:hypothetical protein
VICTIFDGFLATSVGGEKMTDLLKGNFETSKKVDDKDERDETLEERFEKEALKKLGGSIAFVSKNKVMWDDEEKS